MKKSTVVTRQMLANAIQILNKAKEDLKQAGKENTAEYVMYEHLFKDLFDLFSYMATKSNFQTFTVTVADIDD